METMLIRLINWLNAEPVGRSVRLQRDGSFAFLGFADLNQPPAPLITFQSLVWMIILVIGLPVVFLA